VSVDTATSSFVADAYVVSGPADPVGGWGGPVNSPGGGGYGPGGRSPSPFAADFSTSAPTLTPVTITTTSATILRVEGSGSSDTLGGLTAGDEFLATFAGSPSDALTTIVSTPALSVSAHTPPTARQVYAFVGTVTAVDTTGTPNTVTVSVTDSLPGGLVASGSAPQTFTVSDATEILGGSTTDGLSGGTRADVATNDTVAGVLAGATGETLAQVESSPLQVLIDFPATSTTSTTTATANRTRALDQALSLLGVKSTTKKKRSGTRRSRTHHRRSTSRR
jgi:hypothetical protein